MLQEVTDIKNIDYQSPDILSDSDSLDNSLCSDELSEEEMLEWITYLTEREAIRDLKKLKKKMEKKRAKRKRTLDNIADRRAKRMEKTRQDRRRRLDARKKRRKRLRLRNEFLKQKKKEGDKYGYFMVMKMKDGKRLEKVSWHKWMNDAYKSFNTVMNDYKENVIGDVIYTGHYDKWTKKRWLEGPFKYEVILLKRIDPEKDEQYSYIRNDNGKAIMHVVEDDNNYIILEKAPWGIPETYYVYGYDKEKDRKTGKWIMENLILDGVSKKNVRRVFKHGNRIVIQKGIDFELVICRGKDDCDRLYDSMSKYCVLHKHEYVFFTGDILNSLVSKWEERIQKKTGWKKNALKARDFR